MSLNPLILLFAIIALIASSVFLYSANGGGDISGYILMPLINLLAAVAGGLIVVLLTD